MGRTHAFPRVENIPHQYLTASRPRTPHVSKRTRASILRVARALAFGVLAFCAYVYFF